MKKIDGLKFLNTYFNNYAINSTFIENENDLYTFYNNNINREGLFRVRGCNRYGSELNLPMASFHNTSDVINYILNEKSKNSQLDFVIHCVDDLYFNPIYIGTVAVYNNYDKPSIEIDIQRVTKELVNSMNKIRPRDWPVSVSLEYDFLSKSPTIYNYDNVNLEEIKDSIYKLFKIGLYIYNIYDKDNIEIDTYTRFNIYETQDIILDDHRSVDSFVLKK